MQNIKINPSMFIHSPYKKCPKCNQEKFGILMILEQSYTRRCCSCFYPGGYEPAEQFDLPKLDKKIVYLDQFAISEMAKVKKDPSQRKDWLELYNLIDGLVLDQVIVCPDSHYHEQESRLSVSLNKDLKDFYEQMSRGITFSNPHDIESSQVYKALKKFVGEDKTETYDFSDGNGAFNNNPNSWQDKIHIRVNLGEDPNEIKRLRLSKEKYLEIMKEHFQGLPNRSKFDFFEEVKVWQVARANAISQLYYNYIKEYIEMCFRIKPFDPMWFLNSPVITELAEQILYFFEGRGVTDKIEQLKRMREFLYSDYFYNIPHVLIGSLFNAGISRKFVYGTRKEPKSGDYYDIQIIEHLLPYCDAMLIDNETRAILTEEPINTELKKRFKTLLFSISKRDEFIGFLRELQNQMSPEIREAVIEVYGKLQGKGVGERGQSELIK